MRTLSVHHLTAASLPPEDFIDTVARAGGHAVSLFAHPQGGHFPCITDDNVLAVRRRLRDNNIALLNVDAFMLTAETVIESLRFDLDRGAKLGAQRATAILFDAEQSRGSDNLQKLCELAAESGMSVALEFMPFAPRGRTLQEANQLLDDISAPNLSITVDVLHLIRSGGIATDLQSLAARSPERISTVQVCDSQSLAVTTDYVEEAANQRELPGNGIFALGDILSAAPATCSIELEAPCKTDQGIAERIKQGLASLTILANQ